MMYTLKLINILLIGKEEYMKRKIKKLFSDKNIDLTFVEYGEKYMITNHNDIISNLANTHLLQMLCLRFPNDNEAFERLIANYRLCKKQLGLFKNIRHAHLNPFKYIVKDEQLVTNDEESYFCDKKAFIKIKIIDNSNEYNTVCYNEYILDDDLEIIKNDENEKIEKMNQIIDNINNFNINLRKLENYKETDIVKLNKNYE